MANDRPGSQGHGIKCGICRYVIWAVVIEQALVCSPRVWGETKPRPHDSSSVAPQLRDGGASDNGLRNEPTRGVKTAPPSQPGVPTIKLWDEAATPRPPLPQGSAAVTVTNIAMSAAWASATRLVTGR
jgi:hypothetical protein